MEVAICAEMKPLEPVAQNKWWHHQSKHTDAPVGSTNRSVLVSCQPAVVHSQQVAIKVIRNVTWYHQQRPAEPRMGRQWLAPGALWQRSGAAQTVTGACEMGRRACIRPNFLWILPNQYFHVFFGYMPSDIPTRLVDSYVWTCNRANRLI